MSSRSRSSSSSSMPFSVARSPDDAPAVLAARDPRSSEWSKSRRGPASHSRDMEAFALPEHVGPRQSALHAHPPSFDADSRASSRLNQRRARPPSPHDNAPVRPVDRLYRPKPPAMLQQHVANQWPVSVDERVQMPPQPAGHRDRRDSYNSVPAWAPNRVASSAPHKPHVEMGRRGDNRKEALGRATARELEARAQEVLAERRLRMLRRQAHEAPVAVVRQGITPHHHHRSPMLSEHSTPSQSIRGQFDREHVSGASRSEESDVESRQGRSRTHAGEKTSREREPSPSDRFLISASTTRRPVILPRPSSIYARPASTFPGNTLTPPPSASALPGSVSAFPRPASTFSGTILTPPPSASALPASTFAFPGLASPLPGPVSTLPGPVPHHALSAPASTDQDKIFHKNPTLVSITIQAHLLQEAPELPSNGIERSPTDPNQVPANHTPSSLDPQASRDSRDHGKPGNDEVVVKKEDVPEESASTPKRSRGSGLHSPRTSRKRRPDSKPTQDSHHHNQHGKQATGNPETTIEHDVDSRSLSPPPKRRRLPKALRDLSDYNEAGPKEVAATLQDSSQEKSSRRRIDAIVDSSPGPPPPKRRRVPKALRDLSDFNEAGPYYDPRLQRSRERAPKGKDDPAVDSCSPGPSTLKRRRLPKALRDLCDYNEPGPKELGIRTPSDSSEEEDTSRTIDAGASTPPKRRRLPKAIRELRDYNEPGPKELAARDPEDAPSEKMPEEEIESVESNRGSWSPSPPPKRRLLPKALRDLSDFNEPGPKEVAECEPKTADKNKANSTIASRSTSPSLRSLSANSRPRRIPKARKDLADYLNFTTKEVARCLEETSEEKKRFNRMMESDSHDDSWSPGPSTSKGRRISRRTGTSSCDYAESAQLEVSATSSSRRRLDADSPSPDITTERRRLLKKALRDLCDFNEPGGKEREAEVGPGRLGRRVSALLRTSVGA